VDREASAGSRVTVARGVLIGLMIATPAPGLAQSPITVHLSAHAIVAWTRVDPVPYDSAMAETEIEQPMVGLMAAALRDHLRFEGTLNLEGLTMPGGALTLGGWGEGFNERRHPHTYSHEVIVSGVAGPMNGPQVSLTAGKGFVPFGTDDPMNRPALEFPVNHHWSQILERALVSSAARVGPATLEATLFNGDEPERPGQWPLLSRFGDSWAVRLGAEPAPGIDLQGSRAHVKSPEHRLGAGTPQEKWSVSARLERPLGAATLYALTEWARTEELSVRYTSWLLEAQWTRGPHRPYYRLERTDRPEEERLLDPFRSVRPHLENSILGVTRWTVHTAGYGFTIRTPVLLEPIVELGYATVAETTGGIFNVAGFFGRTSLWSLTVALRVRSPGPAHRMGRYGIADPMMHHH